MQAGGGTEVASHLDELAAALAGIDDRFNMPDFAALRNAGLTALVVAEPLRMGRWLAHQFFVGDYGLSQRAALLMAIGLGARELAGLEPEPPLQHHQQHQQRRKLPPRLDAVWGADSRAAATAAAAAADPIAAITDSLKATYLAPLAAAAADAATGPNVLKVRTFSSRMAVEARRAPPTNRRILDLVAPAFFFPLTGGWFVLCRRADRADRAAPPQADPPVLVLFLHTLAVLLHAAGPGTPALHDMTSEYLELLLSLRRPAAAAASDGGTVCEAVLLGLLTLLEVNLEAAGGRQLAETCGPRLVELRGWVEGLLDGTAEAASTAEAAGVRALAAGVLVRLQQVVETWQRALLGGLGVDDSW